MLENWEQYKGLEYYPDGVCGCRCEGKIKVQSHHRYYGIPKFISGHQNRGKRHSNYGKPAHNRIPREIRECACGKCGETFECKVNSKQRFIRGHNLKLHKIRMFGNANPTKRPEVRKKMNKTHIGKLRPEHSKFMKSLWEDVGYREKQLKAMFKGFNLKPNKPEKFLINLLQKLYPDEWKFVGDGQIFIARRVPDFVNVNGQKKIIELYGDYWHRNDNPQDRIDLFAQYGYQTLIIWEHELKNKAELKTKLQEFCDVRYEIQT